MRLQPSAVKQFALAHGIEVFQPSTLRAEHAKRGAEGAAAQARLRAVFADAADVMVVAAYGLMLPQGVLDMPAFGCINIHASLLPRWRGAAPIHRAIEAGDAATGITIMRMDAGLDTGPMLLKAVVPIAPTDTTSSLHDRLATLGGELIVDALARIGSLQPQDQSSVGAIYAPKIEKHEAAVDFDQASARVVDKIRAFDPFPGAAARLQVGPDSDPPFTIKLWRAQAGPGHGAPGTVLQADADGVVIACADGAIRVTELQKPGGKRLSAREFLGGTPIAAGARFLPVPLV